MSKIIRLIDGVHMGLGHLGLELLARKNFGIEAKNLGPGEILMFLNRKRDKLKILGAGGHVVGYLRMPHGQRIMLEALQYIPQTFGHSGEINYSASLKRALAEQLVRRNYFKGKPRELGSGAYA